MDSQTDDQTKARNPAHDICHSQCRVPSTDGTSDRRAKLGAFERREPRCENAQDWPHCWPYCPIVTVYRQDESNTVVGVLCPALGSDWPRGQGRSRRIRTRDLTDMA